MFANIPQVQLGVIAVSRSCFPRSLSERRRRALCAAHGGAYECPVVVESESDAMAALADVKRAGVNALAVYLGNFGPETPETLLCKYFDGPVMYLAAAEGDGDLFDGRGDAYCGLLNCSYNLNLRSLTAHIPARPVGTARELAEEMRRFSAVAAAILGLSRLKIISFGPRPYDFLACNAPIKPLFDLGVEIQENSELDLLASFNAHAGDARIAPVVAEMEADFPSGNPYAGVLGRLAQYELTLLDWARDNLGSRSSAAFANKCWPAFQTEFGFVPCYVNSRLAARGIPVACETDIYGALSEYIGACISGEPVTLLDVNNTVPASMYAKMDADFPNDDLFMGFHCGNTPGCMLKAPRMSYQRIMKRLLEPELAEPNITRGTIEGDIRPGDITLFRLQGGADGKLRAYVAQGATLDTPSESFGGIGVFRIPEMGRFYRHVLIEKAFPHHAAVAFGRYGKELFDVFRYLGVGDISYNRPKEIPYPTENPFA
ncbi:MAG TPA: fucose isomerase [Clostridia bacterium]|nr:fucose isomerase [Clostridia bacterium]